MRVVCDTDVLVAGVVADGLRRDTGKRRLLGVDLVTSQILLEVREARVVARRQPR